MTVHALRANLWIVGIALALTGTGVAAWSVLAPLGVEEGDRTSETAGRGSENSPIDRDDTPGVAQSSLHWSKPLQRPLVDPVAPAHKAAPINVPTPWRLPVTVKLIGTIMEPGQPRAVLQTGTSEFEVRRTGERLGGVVTGAEIVTIEERHIVIRYNGQEAKLPLAEAERLPVTEGN